MHQRPSSRGPAFSAKRSDRLFRLSVGGDAFFDRFGEFGLPGVMGYARIDAMLEWLVIGPHGTDPAFAAHCVTGTVPSDRRHAADEFLLSHRAGFHVDVYVVVAAFVTPRAG